MRKLFPAEGQNLYLIFLLSPSPSAPSRPAGFQRASRENWPRAGDQDDNDGLAADCKLQIFLFMGPHSLPLRPGD